MSYNPEEIARVCGGVKRTTNGFDCSCPAHEDKKASLSVSDEGLIHCHAGCSFNDVKEALKARGVNLNGEKPSQNIIYYQYNDENNQPLFRKVKILPEKKFFIQSFKNNEWVKGLGDVKRVLYKLPELKDAIKNKKSVAIAEGEKDCDSVFNSYGVVCTCNVGGAGHWLDSYNNEFKGADVAIFYDNDEPGVERKDYLIKSLTGVAAKLAVIHVPNEFKDISDFIASGKDKSELVVQYIESPKSLMLDAGDWLDKSSYKIDPLVEGLFDVGDKVVIIGKSKTRKSFFALQLLLSCVTGQSFLGLEIPQFRKALLIQYEIKEAHFHRRLERMCDSLGILPQNLMGRFSIINARGQDINKAQVIEYIKQSGAEIVLFDPLYKLMEGAENAVEDFKPILKWFDEIAEATKAAILYVHHDKKGFVGEQDTADRGAGSSILGRDFDASFYLTPHENKDLVVLQALTRNYAPRPDTSIQWLNGSFVSSEELVRIKTSRSPRADKPKLEDWEPSALSLLQDINQLPVTEFIQKLNDMGASKHMARAVMDKLLSNKKIESCYIKAAKGAASKFIKIKHDYNSSEVFPDL